MFDTMDSVYLERAKFARDTEYMKAMASDVLEDQRVMDFIMEDADDITFNQDPDIDSVIDGLQQNDENDEINNILNASDMITFDQMLGIDTSDDVNVFDKDDDSDFDMDTDDNIDDDYE